MRPRAVKLQQGASSSLAAGSSDAVEPGVSVQKKTFPPAAAYQSLAPVKSTDRVSAGNDCTTAAQARVLALAATSSSYVLVASQEGTARPGAATVVTADYAILRASFAPLATSADGLQPPLPRQQQP